MRGLYEALHEWATKSGGGPECPQCEARLADEYPDPVQRPPTPTMEDTRVRDPSTQEHFTGVDAWQCPECGYAERQ